MYFSLMEYIGELPRSEKRRGASSAAVANPYQRKKGRTTTTVVRPFFLAYLDAGFLFLGLDAVELRIGSAKQVLPGINAITNPCVADGHPQQIRDLCARELVADCRA